MLDLKDAAHSSYAVTLGHVTLAIWIGQLKVKNGAQKDDVIME
jgi:hypothetical protein